MFLGLAEIMKTDELCLLKLFFLRVMGLFIFFFFSVHDSGFSLFSADFCWMCLGDWKTHGSEYYECSRYKENPDIVNQSQQAQAREALKKYLFYFERVGDISLARAAVAF